MPSQLRSPRAIRANQRQILLLTMVVAAVVAAASPAGLTGHQPIDVLERAVLAGGSTFVGAHGRRQAWLAATALLVLPARGASLGIVAVAAVILLVASLPRRRRKDLGGIAVGLLVAVPFWYRPGAGPLAPAAGVASISVLVASGYPFLRRHRRKVARMVLLALAGLVVACGAAAAIAVGRAATSVNAGTQAARDALAAARDGDGDRAATELAEAREAFDRARSSVGGPIAAPAALVPVLSQQMTAIQAAIDEGRSISKAADDLVATADYDRLTYSGRIDLDQVDALAGPSARTSSLLRRASQRLTNLRRGWLLPPLADKLDDFAAQLDDAGSDTDLAAELLQVTPGLLGGDGPRRYLAVLVTPAELRGSGGFIGSWAELTAVDGKMRLTRSGRIRELIDGARPGTRHITGPADYLRRYGRFQPADYLQDITLSPDFPSDASVLQQIYPQSGGLPVDGVLSIDPKGLASLLRLTGPVEVPGLDAPLTSANAEEVLLRSQYLTIPDRAERGEILTGAIKATFERLTEASLPAPREIAEAMSATTRSGHLRMWSPKASEEALFRSLGADGTLALPRGEDGFSVVQQNVGNNKLDAYVHRTIRYHATVDARTGRLTARLEVDLRNDAPALDAPVAVVGNQRGAPVGTNLATLSVYTRGSVRAATIDGKAVALAPDTELGLQAYDTPVLRIPAGGTVHVVLDLVGGVTLSHGYALRILPQPVANPDQLQATLDIRHGQAEDGGRGRITLFPSGDLTVPITLRAGVHG